MIDTHAHLTDERLLPFTDEIVKSGLKRIVTVGCNAADCVKAYALAREYGHVFCALGIHPHDAKDYDDNAESGLRRLIAGDNNKKVVALGEIGLDFHYDLSPRDAQRKAFEKQILLANEFNLPVVLHVREAADDALSILRENRQFIENGLLFHCFAEDKVYANKILNTFDKAYFAFGGAVTFKNSDRAAVAASLPVDRVLLETDCPYMTPVPYRGQLNKPQYLNLVLNRLIEETGLTDLEKITDENAGRFFGFR
ncbi:MAG: TatD family hydrolase [Christensenellaceae bacterium]|jgi:TatD DNase family protein|nr:TatD family hydrolase [Christensenellaceae bacterium]